MRINILTIVGIFFLLTACQPSPEVKFDKMGVRFTCPEGWKITEEEDMGEEGYYLSVEKNGFDASAIMSITWVDEEINLADFLLEFQESLKENTIYAHSGLSFEAQIETTFNKRFALASKYSARVLGIAHQGTIYCFKGGGARTFAILKQEAIEDRQKNKAGFDTIVESFFCQ